MDGGLDPFPAPFSFPIQEISVLFIGDEGQVSGHFPPVREKENRPDKIGLLQQPLEN